MTYSKTKFQLSHLLQEAWYKMGQMQTWVATGGSATTVVNSAWAGVEEQFFDDDDPSLIYGSVVVIEDAGGAGADPEGRIGQITDYDSSTYTITMDTVTTAVASGDRIGLASPLFPFQDMKELANIAIRKLGKIDLVDTSLSVVAGQTEYTLPIRVAPKRVKIQRNKASGDNLWEDVQGWRVIPQTAGTNWTLIIPSLSQGHTLQIQYEDLHPKLTAYDSEIAEIFAPELVTTALVAEAYQWYNNRINGSNDYFKQRENKALQDLEQAKALFPMYKMDEQVQGLPHWGRRSEYVPLTSDLRA